MSRNIAIAHSYEDKELAALRAEVKRLREERRWRDATTELPAGSEYCLCRFRNPRLTEGWFNPKEGWVDYYGNCFYPTHWMPLPAPPAKEE